MQVKTTAAVSLAILALTLGFLSGCSLAGVFGSPSSSGSGTTDVSTTNFDKQSDGSYLYQTNDPANCGQTYYYVSTNQVSGAYTYEATVRKTSGAAAGGYGIVFRWIDDGDFWLADIDTQGYFTLAKDVNGTLNYVTVQNNVVWLPCSALKTGYGVSNTIKLVYDGGANYSLYFNGILAMNFTDTPSSPGGLGFDAAVFKSGENFPSVPVSVSFTVDTPTLTFAAVLANQVRMIGELR